jgi:hypothetical protein
MRPQNQEGNKRTSFLLAEIKRALDNVRTSLWCRMQAASGHNPKSAMLVDQHRLQRVVDLLRSPAVERTTQCNVNNELRGKDAYISKPMREADLLRALPAFSGVRL